MWISLSVLVCDDIPFFIVLCCCCCCLVIFHTISTQTARSVNYSSYLNIYHWSLRKFSLLLTHTTTQPLGFLSALINNTLNFLPDDPNLTLGSMTFRFGFSGFTPKGKSQKIMFTLLACKERIQNEEIPSELLDVYKIQCKAEIDSARYVILHLLTSLSRET